MNEYEIKYKLLFGFLNKILKDETITSFTKLDKIEDIVKMFEQDEGEKENGTN